MGFKNIKVRIIQNEALQALEHHSRLINQRVWDKNKIIIIYVSTYENVSLNDFWSLAINCEITGLFAVNRFILRS